MTARARKAPAKAAKAPRAPKPAPAPSGPGAGAVAGAVVSGLFGGAGVCLRALGRGTWALLRASDFQRLVALGILGGALVGTSGLVRERVEAASEFALHLELPADAPPPPGLSPLATRDLAAIRLPRGAHAFHEGVIPGLAAHLSRLPWVAKVEELRLLPPAKIELRLRTHRPVAQIGLGEGPLVAREADLIPRVYGAQPERLPRLLGVSPSDKDALRAGVSVLEALGPLAAQVEAVDLANLHGRQDPRKSEVVLTLAGGLRVDWGRCEPRQTPDPAAEPTPETLGPARRTPEEKRADLEAFLQSFPQVAQVERVSLRFDEVTYVLREAAPGEPPAVTRR